MRVRWSEAVAALSAIFMTMGIAASTWAATTVDSQDYPVLIEHRLLAQSRLESGVVALRIALRLRNDSSHDLLDLRLFLDRAEPAQLLPDCEPARVERLTAGSQKEGVWTFECLIGSLPSLTLDALTLRIEAIDQGSQDIVTFSRDSVEAH